MCHAAVSRGPQTRLVRTSKRIAISPFCAFSRCGVEPPWPRYPAGPLGEPWQFLTAAYWIGLTERWIAEHPVGESHGLGKSLVQEVVACLLGGHGITYELNVSAFRAMDDSGLVTLARRASEDRLREVSTIATLLFE